MKLYIVWMIIEFKHKEFEKTKREYCFNSLWNCTDAATGIRLQRQLRQFYAVIYVCVSHSVTKDITVCDLYILNTW